MSIGGLIVSIPSSFILLLFFCGFSVRCRRQRGRGGQGTAPPWYVRDSLAHRGGSLTFGQQPCTVSLTAPKLAARSFRKEHWLGGRFVPPYVRPRPSPSFTTTPFSRRVCELIEVGLRVVQVSGEEVRAQLAPVPRHRCGCPPPSSFVLVIPSFLLGTFREKNIFFSFHTRKYVQGKVTNK
jgi:hypothetical protein